MSGNSRTTVDEIIVALNAGETITEDFNIRDYQKEAIKNTMAQVASMVGVEFKNVKYFDLDIPKNSIVYCDPPYFGTTKYSQNFDHDYFWDWVKLISKKNSVYISEYSAPKEFECIWEKETRSSLSANGSCGGSKKSVEKLFRLTRKE